MQSLLHALNIGTMATWLSVSGASTVACLVSVDDRQPVPKEDSRLDASFGDVIDLDAAPAELAAGSAAPGEPVAEPEMAEASPAEPLPVEQVAALPELAEVAPLPEIPDLPEPKADDLQSSMPKPQARPASSRQATAMVPARSRPAGGANGTTGVGNGGGTGSAAGSGSGDSGAGAARLSRGRIPKPKYPEECRRGNQEGRVVITFTVDERGDVVSAKVTNGCPYASMNQAALDAVYRGKFPAGPRASASKAIIFKLR